jgi:hypothetical protein
VANTTLCFGKTGSGKTTSFGEAAKYLYEKTGKPGRGIYSDGGGWKSIQGVVDSGIVEPYNITDEPNMPVLLHMLARGYWPDKLEDGLRPKGVKLTPQRGLDKVGFYLYEGLTSSSELLMRYLRDRQIPIGGDAVGKFTVKDEEGKDWLFCANNMKHYDWVQGEMMVILAELTALPVAKVLISAHEAQGTDEDSKDPIRGPALVGKAGTGKIGKNVGDCIHYETYLSTAKDATATTAIRGYYKTHPDPKFPNIMYDCKARVPLAEIGGVEKAFPNGFFDPRDLGKFLEACDQAVNRSTTALKAWRAEVDAHGAGAPSAAKVV